VELVARTRAETGTEGTETSRRARVGTISPTLLRQSRPRTLPITMRTRSAPFLCGVAALAVARSAAAVVAPSSPTVLDLPPVASNTASPSPPAPPVVATSPPSGLPCTEVDGPPNIMLTFDGGKTLVESKTARTPGMAVTGLVALGPHVLAALAGRYAFPEPYSLFVSVDGGCHWSDRGRIDATRLVEGRNGVAYASGRRVYEVTARGARNLGGPLWLDAVAVDSHNERHLRGVGLAGVYDCMDATSPTWRKVAATESRGRAVTFDPTDLDHILVHGYGRIVATRNGGRSWVTLGASDASYTQRAAVSCSSRPMKRCGRSVRRSSVRGTEAPPSQGSQRQVPVDGLGTELSSSSVPRPIQRCDFLPGSTTRPFC